MTQFEEGALCAAGLLAYMYGQPTIAADIICELGFTNSDCSDLDEYDKDNLRLIKDGRLNLRGL